MDNPRSGERRESWEIDVTGSQSEPTRFHVAEFTFGKYLVKVKLDECERFNGILEIRINKDFIDRLQSNYHDVDKFYMDEESEEK